MFNYQMKLELGVVALKNEIAIFQAKKPQQYHYLNTMFIDIEIWLMVFLVFNVT
jgi:hypothetical protein